MTDRLIFVLGVPSGGTSVVAGILHRLGVDMGDPFIASRRPYETFEDATVRRRYSKPTPLGHVSQQIIPGQQNTLRHFRQYCEMRLGRANGQPCGVKIGSTVWLGEPNPETLPIRIVRVTRPLEDSIRSNWQYGEESGDQAIRRAMQVAGYWACCEELCQHIRPACEIEYYRLLREPMVQILGLMNALGLTASQAQILAARKFVDPGRRHV